MLNVNVNCHQGSHQMDSSRQEVEVESQIKINVFNGEDKLSFYCFVVNMLDRDNERIWLCCHMTLIVYTTRTHNKQQQTTRYRNHTFYYQLLRDEHQISHMPISQYMI